jgi:hypothetical protein
MQFLMWLTLISRGKTPEAATVQLLDDCNTDQVVIHCKAVVQQAERVITSWQLRSGEFFDVMSIENLEAAAGKAKESVEVKEYLYQPWTVCYSYIFSETSINSNGLDISLVAKF